MTTDAVEVRFEHDGALMHGEQFPLPDMSGWTNIYHKQPGIIEVTMPRDALANYDNDAAVDKTHVRQLRDEMVERAAEVGGSGQEERVSVAAVPERGNDIFKWDGFHRDEALGLKGELMIDATLFLGFSWRDVLNRRIKKGTGHRTVKFSRQVEWMEEVWDASEWGERNLTIINAINLVLPRRDGSFKDGAKYGLTPDETAEMREWIKTNCDYWELAPKTILNNLREAEYLCPELIRMRRDGDGANTVTMSHLRVGLQAFPGETDMQILLAQTVEAHDLSVAATKIVADKLEAAAYAADGVPILAELDFDLLKRMRPRMRDIAKSKVNGKSVEMTPLQVIEQLPTTVRTLDDSNDADELAPQTVYQIRAAANALIGLANRADPEGAQDMVPLGDKSPDETELDAQGQNSLAQLVQARVDRLLHDARQKPTDLDTGNRVRHLLRVVDEEVAVARETPQSEIWLYERCIPDFDPKSLTGAGLVELAQRRKLTPAQMLAAFMKASLRPMATRQSVGFPRN